MADGNEPKDTDPIGLVDSGGQTLDLMLRNGIIQGGIFLKRGELISLTNTPPYATAIYLLDDGKTRVRSTYNLETLSEAQT